MSPSDRASDRAAARRPRRRRRHRGLQGRPRCCGCSPRRPRRPRRAHPRRRCGSSARRPGRRCPATRSPPTSGPTCTRCRTSGSGSDADLVVVAPATADLLARAAHGLADDLLTTTLLTARCPVVFAPAMHTEMWEHPATQANVATLRERGVRGPRARRRPADRRRHRAGPAARARARSSPAARARAGSARRRRAGRRPGRADASWSAPAAPASRSTRCATSATAPRASRATRSPRSPRPAAPKVTLVAANVVAARRRPASTSSRSAPRSSCSDAVHGRGRATPTSSSWRRRSADFRPGDLRGGQDQEDRRRRRARPTIELVRNPDILAELVARPRCGRAAGDRRVRRRDRRRRPATCWTSAAPSWPARAATCSSSTRSASTRPSGPTDNTVHLLFRDGLTGSPRDHTPARTQGGDRRRGLGRACRPCSIPVRLARGPRDRTRPCRCLATQET